MTYMVRMKPYFYILTVEASDQCIIKVDYARKLFSHLEINHKSVLSNHLVIG